MNSSALSRVGHFWFSECILLWYICLTGDGRVLSEQHLPRAEARRGRSSPVCRSPARAAVSHGGRIPLTQGKIELIRSILLVWALTGCGVPLVTLLVNQDVLVYVWGWKLSERACCKTGSAAACVLALRFCFSFLEALWARTRGVTRQGKEDVFLPELYSS